MNSETGTDMMPKKEPSAFRSYPWWYGLVPTLVLSFALFAVFGVPKILDAYKEKVPPTEVELFIGGGEDLIKDGVRVWIHTDKHWDLQGYTRLGDVPGLTEVYDRLRVRGYRTANELALSAPYPTMISCGLGRFSGDFSLQCTKLLSAEYPHMLGSEDPEKYLGMQIDLRTRKHLGERVDWLEFQQALYVAVRVFSQAAAGRAPTVKG